VRHLAQQPSLKISEVFFSIQGEGIYIGLPTIFIRLFGCNLRCAWCDTTYARIEEEGKWRELSPHEILKAVSCYSSQHVCITGGEPLLQQEIYTLILLLRERGYTISVETNGSLPLQKLVKMPVTISMDIKTPSSGMEKKMLFENISLLRKEDMLKFVIADEIDFKYSCEVLKTYPTKACVVFTPVGGKNLGWLVSKVLEKEIEVRVLPQLHKFVFPEKERTI